MEENLRGGGFRPTPLGPDRVKYSGYGSLRYLFNKKATFRIVFEQNCENTTVKKARNKGKGGFPV